MIQRLGDIAAALGLEIRPGDGAGISADEAAAFPVSGLGTLQDAGEDQVSFLANPKYAPQLENTRAAAVICDEAHAGSVRVALVSAAPYLDFARALKLFERPRGSFVGVSDQARIDSTARIGDSVTIYPGAFVGKDAAVGDGTVLFPGVFVGDNCRIGSGCTLYPNVCLMADTEIGDSCILHAGVVLGSDGFGFAPTPAGLQKIPQNGRVVVGNDVEIGANTTVDRAVLGATTIGDNTKIDNLVQIGHNVTVGRSSVIVAQVGISGSTTVGDGVTLAGQAGISGHLSIGSGATVGPQSGVAKDIPAGATVGGQPSMDRGTFMRTMALIPKLPDLARRIRSLENELSTLKDLLQQGDENA